MEIDQIAVFSVIILALILFVWGKIRHDLVAVLSLLILVSLGVIETGNAFSGFSHPAVITVAVILVISTGLKNSGLIDLIGQGLDKLGDNFILQISVLSVVVMVASAFMNNVGALAILMPVAIHVATKSGKSPSLYLMPIAYASLLGGMLTLIGTPPNIIISTFREEKVGGPYGMFDFFPAGLGLALVGLVFIVFISWRLIPKRVGSKEGQARFKIDEYITELIVSEGSSFCNKTIAEAMEKYEAVQLIQVIRQGQIIHAPLHYFRLRSGDILTMEANAEQLKELMDRTNLEMVPIQENRESEVSSPDIITNAEAVIMPESILIGRTASGMRIRNRFGVIILAISRQGAQIQNRIDHVPFKAGDVVLVQGSEEKLDVILQQLGCLPLADRGYKIEKKGNIFLGAGIFIAAILLVVAGIMKVEIAFTLAALGMVLTGIISKREIYTSIDWPVIVLLAAMLPVGMALEESGGSKQIAGWVLDAGAELPSWVTLYILFLVTMVLSNVINNAATVVLMAPIGLQLADDLQASSDPFLMTIAIASSAAFMTPIGHQSNTLVMGPGGYKFADYLITGLPLSLIIMTVAIPLILYFWPF